MINIISDNDSHHSHQGKTKGTGPGGEWWAGIPEDYWDDYLDFYADDDDDSDNNDSDHSDPGKTEGTSPDGESKKLT